MSTTLPEHWHSGRFVIGVAIALFAAFVMIVGEGSVAAPITLLIVGIVFIATSRRT